LPTTRHRSNLEVWALMQSCGDGHRSLVTLERVLSEYNEDLFYFGGGGGNIRKQEASLQINLKLN